jgi:hypothetical protein
MQASKLETKYHPSHSWIQGSIDQGSQANISLIQKPEITDARAKTFLATTNDVQSPR